MGRVGIAVLLMAVVTYIPRVLPIAVFRHRIKSTFFKSFLYYIPFAVLGVMTFPGILYSTGNIYFSAAGMLAALALAYFEKSLLKVAVGAVAIVFILQLIFR